MTHQDGGPRGQSSSQAGVSLNPISIPLPDHSGRGGTPKIIVLHDTEGHNEAGTKDLYTLADVLRGEGLSVHVGNDAEGNCARYVEDDQSAYHVAAYNDVALGIEQIGFATQSSWPDAQVDNTAKWIAHWSQLHHIPITHSTSHGICRHKDLGAAGGGHTDPGPAYPFGEVLKRAAQYAGTTVVESGSPSSGGAGQTTTTGGSGGASLEDVEAISKATAFAAYLNLPDLFNSIESEALKGDRSLMNDSALFPFIEQLTQATLRRFQSLPNGDFFAFYPDYFGGLNHRTPYWSIHDIEIIDGQIELSDDALATHVYAVGDVAGFWDGVDMYDRVQTAGVVTVFNAFMADFMNGLPDGTKVKKDIPALNTKDKAITFLKKYGARPLYLEEPMIRSPFYEAFYAYQQFCYMWAMQFKSNFTLTYMPELYPGGIVAFPDHYIQMFVEEVQHDFDYETGFQTRATFTAPTALPNAPRQDVHAGMIRSGIFENHGP